MGTLVFNLPTLVHPIINRIPVHRFGRIASASANIQFCGHHKNGVRFPNLHGNFSYSSSQSDGDEDPENLLQELRVPSHWLEPSKASEEAEWLRVTLHKWLDNEYCPEVTNIEISKVAANSFYKSLVEKRTDLGEILLKMAVELESISYQESFHGAFSSANAAVDLILQRISQE